MSEYKRADDENGHGGKLEVKRLSHISLICCFSLSGGENTKLKRIWS